MNSEHFCTSCEQSYAADSTAKKCPCCGSMNVESWPRKTYYRIKNRLGNKAELELVSRHEPSRDEIKHTQALLGYHPAGYGDPMEVHSERYKNFHVTRWRVWASCD